MPSRETAIVFGVGPGLGWALARRFAAANMEVARNPANLEKSSQAIYLP